MAAQTKLKNGTRSFSVMALSLAVAGAGSMLPLAARADLAWDSSGAAPAAPVDGSGNWDASSFMWSNGASDLMWPNDTTVATIGSGNGVAGTITLQVPITVGGLTFNAATSGNYLLTPAVGADTLTLSGATPTITVNGAIAPTILAVVAGTSGLTYSGNGTLILSNNNTYSGNTLITSGQLQITTTTGFGTSNVTVSSGATANVNVTTNANNFTIAGTGSAGTGALFNQSHSATYSGVITLTGDARLGNGGFSSTYSNQITGTGGVEFYGAGSGASTFQVNSTLNNWTGNTTITASNTGNTTLKMGASNVLPGNALVLNAASTGQAIMDLSGRSPTFAGVFSSGNASNEVIFESSASGNSTLNINLASGSAVYGGAIKPSSGTGVVAVAKTGAGMQTFAGAGTYTGNTTISGGTLSITGSLLSTGNVVVNAATLAGTGNVGLVKLNNVGAIVNPGAVGAGSVGTLTMAGLTTTQAGTMQFDISNAALPATNDAIMVNSAVTFTAATAIVPTAGAQAGTYTLLSAPSITYTATPTVTTPGGIRPGTTYTLVPNATNIQVVVAGGPTSIVWAGGAAGFTGSGADGVTWDNLIGTGAGGSNDENWSNAGIQDFYYEGDSVTFSDANSPSHNVTLSTNVAPGGVTFTNATTYTLSGPGAITGFGALAVSGTGTVVLGNANTYAGGTSVGTGATLQVGDGTNTTAAIGTGPIAVSGTLVFDYSGNPATIANTVSGSGCISLPTNGIKTFSLRWTGMDTGFNGNVSIGAGNRLEVSGASATLGAGANVAVQSGGAFYANGSGNFAGSLSIAGAGWSPDPSGGTFGALRVDTAAATFSGPVTLTGNAEIYVTGAAAAISGNITDDSGGFTLTKAGSNFLILSGTNSYSGGTVVAGGTLQLNSATALPVGVVTLGSAIALGSSAANASGSLDLDGFNATVSGLATSGNGTANTIGDSSTTTPSTLIYAGDDSSFGGKIVDILQTGTQTTGLSVSSGNLTLSGVNSYTGNTSVNDGSLIVGATGSLASPNIAVASSATFTVNAGGSIAATTNLTNNGTVNMNNPARTIATLNSTTGGTLNLNTTVLTVTTGGSYVGGISDGGTGGGLIVPVTAVLTTGPINANSLEVDGKQAFTNTAIRTLSKVNTLTVAGSTGAWTGALDLTSSRLVVEDSSVNRAADIATYKDMVANNAGGTVGIFSSTAAANGQVVVVSDNAIRLSVFGSAASNFGTGVGNVDANSILITEAVPGDANLDGVVDLKDLQVLATHWQQPATDWSQTDFDGNGIIALPDFQALAIHWQNGVGAPGQGSGESFSEALALLPQLGGTSNVPEPASLALLGLGAVSLVARRRRNV